MPPSATPDSPRFNKVLRRWDVVLLSFGAMIGWSWVLISGYWIESAGSLGTFIAEPLTGILTVLIMVPALLAGFDVMPRSAEENNLPHSRIGVLSVCP